MTTKKLITALKRDWSPRPLAALVDSETRSAKEIIAHRIQSDWMGVIVGERLTFVEFTTATCRCDVDESAAIDIFDLLAYLGLWFAGDPDADANGDAVIDIFDLLVFLSCWFTGCP